jgi:hypothetical protein
MQIHVAALTQKALGYDEFTRRAIEQERMAQKKSAPDALTEQQACLSQNRDPVILPQSPEISGERNVRVRRHVVSSPISGVKAENEQKKSMRQRLVVVRGAWRQFQKTRDRDGVYGYLRAVFSVVQHYRGRRRTKRLLRRAFKFGGLPSDMSMDPFAAVIRSTCKKKLDRKAISKWSRALRYAARFKKPRVRLIPFIKNRGGINGCAALYAEHFGRGRR